MPGVRRVECVADTGTVADAGRVAVGRTAAIGGVGLIATVGLAGLAWAAMTSQARGATRRIEDPALRAAMTATAIPPAGWPAAGGLAPASADGVHRPDGSRSTGTAPADLVMVVLGDSTSVGYGVRSPDELPGALLARRLAAALRLPVRLSTHGQAGAISADLHRQLTCAIEQRPEVAVIMIGANDIIRRVLPGRAAVQLGAAVAALRAQHIEVVVATCPDFGVIAPIPQPLRAMLTRWSQRLAALQERAVRGAGGVPVAIGRLVSPGFRGRPELFFDDGFHPSAAGYARAVEAMSGDVVAAARRALSRRTSGGCCHGEQPAAGRTHQQP